MVVPQLDSAHDLILTVGVQSARHGGFSFFLCGGRQLGFGVIYFLHLGEEVAFTRKKTNTTLTDFEVVRRP